jgi:hypothetical protein
VYYKAEGIKPTRACDPIVPISTLVSSDISPSRLRYRMCGISVFDFHV